MLTQSVTRKIEPISHLYASEIDSMDSYMRSRGEDWIGGAVLLFEMVVRAEYYAEYGAMFAEWMRRGSTMTLRALGEPFGGYWNSLILANHIDSIDAARANLPLP